MAPFRMASLPLMSCLAMYCSPLRHRHFGFRDGGSLVDRDSSWLGTRQETQSASGAAAAVVNGVVVTVAVQALRKVQDTRRAGRHAQSAAFTLQRVHDNGAFVGFCFDHETSSSCFMQVAGMGYTPAPRCVRESRDSR